MKLIRTYFILRRWGMLPARAWKLACYFDRLLVLGDDSIASRMHDAIARSAAARMRSS